MSAYELEVRDTGTPGVAEVELAGELDLTNARELEERLVEVARNGTDVVVDLNRVVFIDSAALHVLFRLARNLGSSRLTIVLDPGAPVARTVEIVGLRDAMRVVPSVATSS
jgi:anti-anti-sigma factor